MFVFIFNDFLGQVRKLINNYENCQPFVYQVIKNSVLNDHLSHAYLFDANNYTEAFDFVISIIKFIFCKDHLVQKDHFKCGGCSICSRIDNGNYPEFKIIEPDGSVIKKEQLLELQEDFNLSSIEGNYRIYLIKDCDKMNKQASNSLLKFLEEPVDGVIAFLLTNHFSGLLDTIVSRCQIFHLKSNSSYQMKNTLENFGVIFDFFSKNNNIEDVDELQLAIIDEVLVFANYYEENGLDFLIYIKKKWQKILNSRDNTIAGFLLLIYLYYDALKYKFSFEEYFFSDHLNDISFIANLNSIDSLIYKIELFQYGYNTLRNNVNVNLLVDDVIIRLGELNEDS